jgi:hypothetical protein
MKRKRKPSKAKSTPHPRHAPEMFGRNPRAFVTKKECIEFLGGMSKKVDRMLHASRHGEEWLKIVDNREGKGGSPVRVTVGSLKRAQRRLEAGEEPPRLPSEARVRPPFTAPAGEISKHGQALLEALWLLPKKAKEVVMQPAKKRIRIVWDDGCTEFVTVVTARGRKTTTINVRFARSGEAPSPLDGYRSDGPDDGPP